MVIYWAYHIIGFSLGYLIDLIIGDPHWMPHPIKLIGRLIGFLDKTFMNPFIEDDKADSVRRDSKKEFRLGLITVLIVVSITYIVTSLIVVLGYVIHPILGIVIEAILSAYTLAATSLRKESMKVFKALKKGDIKEARFAVSMIVGRDTAALDEEGVAKAAVETVAENTSDGVIAPMIYLAIGGPILAMTYKAINTMDSMIGYKNVRYEHFGTVAAKVDDVVNFFPARISAGLMIAVATLDSSYSGKEALSIFKRDRFNHKSPNSAQTESVCAGALGLELAGDASYFGKIVKKPTIGDKTRNVEPEDIKKANKLMYLATGMLVLFVESLWIGLLLVL